MSRMRSEAAARECAKRVNAYYGMSALDGWYYVGTIAQLEGVGCVHIRHWSSE